MLTIFRKNPRRLGDSLFGTIVVILHLAVRIYLTRLTPRSTGPPAVRTIASRFLQRLMSRPTGSSNRASAATEVELLVLGESIGFSSAS